MTVVGVIAVAVLARCVCPARHPSPKKSPGPNTATTASLPNSSTTARFTSPSWIYKTLVAGSSCVKMISLAPYCTTFATTSGQWDEGVTPLGRSCAEADLNLRSRDQDCSLLAYIDFCAADVALNPIEVRHDSLSDEPSPSMRVLMSTYSVCG